MDGEDVRKFVLGLPGAEEHEGWAEQAAFKVRNKGFAYLSADGTTLLLKALREEQEVLVAEQPDVFTAGWAGGRFAWLEIDLLGVDSGELTELITEAWRQTAPRYLVARLDA